MVFVPPAGEAAEEDSEVAEEVFAEVGGAEAASPGFGEAEVVEEVFSAGLEGGDHFRPVFSPSRPNLPSFLSAAAAARSRPSKQGLGSRILITLTKS